MKPLLVMGSGKIGSLITLLLSQSGQYKVYVGDKAFQQTHDNQFHLDVDDPAAIEGFLQDHPCAAVISSLPYHCNLALAEIAQKQGISYFDLTEDINATRGIKLLAEKSQAAFVPQCGLAPGFVGIVANSLIQEFDEVESVQLRVGALPAYSNNALHYALTWSTEGMINEYGNPCYGLIDSELTLLQPLQGLEALQIDGVPYEAFNTSGGLGSLVELYQGKVKNMSYKTIRYPGHCEKMRLLMNDLKLNDDRKTLKSILENAVARTYQDVVIIYVTVNGKHQGELLEKTYMKKVYPQTINEHAWSAIQITTASSLCAVVDIVLNDPDLYKGFVYQETLPLESILSSPFGQYF